MNREETANLLTAMAALDRRTIGAADVIAWQGLLSDVVFGDALEAVKRHYAEQTEWMMPAHVRRLVRDIVREREMAARATGWAPGQAGVPKDQAAPEVGPSGRLELRDLPAAVAAVLAKVRVELPEGSREKLFPRETAWRREHAAYVRTHNAEPNPLYRPNPHAAPLADDSGAYGAADALNDSDGFCAGGDDCGHGREKRKAAGPMCPVAGGPCPGDANGVLCGPPCRVDG